VYFTGGATAVLYGWRTSTLDLDVKFVPERDELFRAIPALKERLRLNIELASPADFIPVRADWEMRSPFIAREGPLYITISTCMHRRWRKSSARTRRIRKMSASCCSAGSSNGIS
jgi:hypothetical protein